MGLNDINSLAHSKWNCKYQIFLLYVQLHFTIGGYDFDNSGGGISIGRLRCCSNFTRIINN